MYYAEVIPRGQVGPQIETLTYHSQVAILPGSIVQIQIGVKARVGVVLSVGQSKPDYATKPLKLINQPPIPQVYLQLAKWIARHYATPLPVVMNTALPAGLAKTRRTQEVLYTWSNRSVADLQPTAPQSKIVSHIDKQSGLSILHGATGSGKTLIYQRLAQRAIKRGQSVLVLVPEIGLTSQIASDLRSVVENTYVLHSSLTEAERHIQWLNILQQDQPILVVGARSAVFAPIKQLGLIIVDEAHESAYKQDAAPRYHTLATATKLAQLHQANVVFGTATPRISDYYLAQLRGYPIYSLARYSKVGARTISVVETTDRSSPNLRVAGK
jgi:primosomal protein N' (replication factor Y)